MKVLLSAYACEPGKGSEPGVGWTWVCGLAGQVHLTVLTRSNNRDPIEVEIASLPHDHPLHGVRFLYHDLPASIRRLKSAGLLPTLPYYFLWQWTAARRFAREADASDIVHHLTFCTALCPGFWNRTKAARVIGPVAAPLVPAAYLPLFGRRRYTQALRNQIIRRFLLLPWLRKSFANAAAIVPANSDMKSLLDRMGIHSAAVLLDTGAPHPAPSNERTIKDRTCRFLYAGVLERRKGLELALRAFAKAQALKTAAAPDMRFVILGKGPDKQRLKELTTALGIADQVDFMGSVSQAEVARRFANADVFVFTSVRDASGGVNLEAMAAGLPILCIAHQGVGDITDDTCSFRVQPASIDETIDALSDGMIFFANHPDESVKMGYAARKRAMNQFSWNAKFEVMTAIYESIVKQHRTNHS